MRKRILGRTGLLVSEIGFGGIPIQRISKEEALNVIKKCKNEGINFIDTARGYTVSEEYIGAAIQNNRRDWILASKSPVRDYNGMKKEVEISLINLKTDYIDLYQFHFVKSLEDLSMIVSENGALKALVEAKEEGKIGHIGITSHSVDILEKALELDLFETIQFPYNLVENQGEKIFKIANEKNVGVIIMKPIAGGAIDNGELSLKYVLNNKNVTVAIPGMETEELVEKNASVGNNSLKLSETDLKELNKIKEKLSGEFCRRCGYCLPCEKGIDIPSQFILEGYLTRYKLKDWAINRYESLEIKSSDCVKCGICETKCPYDLPIIKMLENVSNSFNNVDK
ncbi:aldo/keto reductase [Helicovermis profundi]|uniref:Aldo/keto reductase n=1 Tax=Helicovermis profundi TaxID=3065157 RepID=A0AAU9EDQ2_9FIRM|nr:aldo/keto reductase [Clostridia bacterium S502]